MSAGSTHPSSSRGILGTLNSLPHPSSCLKTLLLWLCRCKYNQKRVQFMRYHADALNHLSLQSPSPFLTSLSVWSPSSASREMGPLTQIICDSLWFRGCHCSSWTSYEHVCSTGNPHSMTEHLKHTKFSRASTKKTWWCKKQRWDALPLGPLLEDKLFPPLSSLTHKQKLWTLPRAFPPQNILL